MNTNRILLSLLSTALLGLGPCIGGCATTSHAGPLESSAYIKIHEPREFAFAVNFTEVPISSSVTMGPVTVGSSLGWTAEAESLAGLVIALGPSGTETN